MLRSKKNNTSADSTGILLKNETEVIVRFNEADPLGIVWHGHYVRYFEDGREAFCKEQGISYLDFYHNGWAIPIVSINCDYKKPLRYGEKIIVETTFIPCVAAKLIFEYRILHPETKEVIAKGSSIQVFVDVRSFELQLFPPQFFLDWKVKNNLNT